MRKVRRNFQERAVSSVVEHLVYTERVGGSKPSPPTLHFRFSTAACRLVSRSSAAGKIIFSHSAYSLADGCKQSFATNDLSWPIFLLSAKISTTSNTRYTASSDTTSLNRS